MQLGQFARIAQNYVVRLSEFVRNLENLWLRSQRLWVRPPPGALPLIRINHSSAVAPLGKGILLEFHLPGFDAEWRARNLR